jgi:ADP-ribose pyrophosphatase
MIEDHVLREEKVAGERVYEGKILDLEIDRVRLPNGVETTREVVRHRGAAVVLPLLEDGLVVFVNQYRYPTGEALLELPAGKLDPDESPRACAARELEEETGWQAGAIHALGVFYTTPGFSDELLHAFVATHLTNSDEVTPDPDEAIELVNLTVEETLAAARDGTIRDGKTLAALLLAQLHGWM